LNEKKFISSWVSKLASDGIKNFPSDFISTTNNVELRLPGKTLLIGEEFFGRYEIITPDGSSVAHTDNYTQAKFILYSNRNKPSIIFLPSDNAELKTAIQLYENYLDTLIKKIENDCKKSLPEEKNYKMVVNEIFRQLNLIRV
jgi:hypothetical protein